MGFEGVLIELHAQARSVWHDQGSVLQNQGVLKDVIAPGDAAGSDPFQNERIGNRSHDVGGGHGPDRSLGVVRSNGDLMCFGQGADLPHFCDTADVDRIGLGHVERSGPEKIVEAVLVGQALRTRNRGGSPLSHPGVTLGIFWNGGFLEEQKSIGFQQAGDFQCGSGVEGGMGIVHEQDLLPQRLAKGSITAVDVPELLPADPGTPSFRDADARFQGSEAFAKNAVSVGYEGVLVRPSEVGVDGYPGGAGTAQEGADRSPQGLSLEVPEGLVDATDGAGENDPAGSIGGSTAGVEVSIDAFDVEGIPPQDVWGFRASTILATTVSLRL